MRYRYFNPNPKKKNGSDCVIRMLCAVTGKTWVDCFLDAAEYSIEIGDMPSVNQVWMKMLKDLGFHRYNIPNCPDCYTIEDFCVDHPKGLYVVGTGTHVVAVRDGFFMDSWDSGSEAPIFYFRR